MRSAVLRLPPHQWDYPVRPPSSPCSRCPAPDGHAVEVKTGLSDGTTTEIVSGDLKEGDQVIVGETAPGEEVGGPRCIADRFAHRCDTLLCIFDWP